MMRAVEIKSPRYRDVSCRICHTFPKTGQVVLVDRLPDTGFGSRDYVMHKFCVELILAAAPIDADERAFEALRDRILDTGSPFSRLM